MITLAKYPYWPARTLSDVIEQLRLICNNRKDDIVQIQNIQSSFISGRKVGRIPSSSIDVIAGDVIGDLNYDPSFIYILLDASGTPAWRRATLASW